MALRSGLEKERGDDGSVISGGTGDVESNASGIELRVDDASARGRADVDDAGFPPAPPPAALEERDAAVEEECEAEEAEGEGVEGEGVEKRRREEEESTAKSGSVSLVRRRSSAGRPAMEEEDEEEAEEEWRSEEEEGKPEAKSGGTAGSKTELS